MQETTAKRLLGKNRGLTILLTLVLLIVIGFSSFIVFFLEGSVVNLQQNYSSIVYNQSGQEIGYIGYGYRGFISYKQIKKSNPLLPQAIVTTQDPSFYESDGFNFGYLLTGDDSHSITMQVANNIILKDATKPRINGFAVNYNLEKEFPKNKILESHLNYIPFGNQVFGVQLASKIYFGKDLTKNKLTPSEIALLIAISENPKQRNPYGTRKQQAEALIGRNQVLEKLSEHKLITITEKNQFQWTLLGTNKMYLQKYLQPLPVSVQQKLETEAANRYHISKAELNSNGYRIYTNVNSPDKNMRIIKILDKDGTEIKPL